MRTRSTFFKAVASVAVFFLLAYCFHRYSGALWVAIQELGTEVDLLSRNERYYFEPRTDLYAFGQLVCSAMILTPAVLAAIYTYLYLSVAGVRFSLRNVFFSTTVVAILLTFGRRIDRPLITESLAEIYVIGATYGSLMLLVTWVLFACIRGFETTHRIESAQGVSK